MEATGALAFVGKGATLLTGSKDKTLKLWDLKCITTRRGQPRAIGTVLAHAKDINALAISPNDRMAASGSQVTRACLHPGRRGERKQGNGM